MTQLFTASDYARISNLVFQDNYPGYKPNIVESPNGDGVKDTKKRYAHVAEKYLFIENESTLTYIKNMGCHPQHNRDSLLKSYLDRAHELAVQVAVTIGVPKSFWPDRRYGALRVLEYNGEATTAPHTDFSLFTLSCYRNLPQYFKYCDPADKNSKRSAWLKTLSESQRQNHLDSLNRAKEINPQIHFGEILEEIDPVNFLANDHEVIPSLGLWQYSIVYFAIPDHTSTFNNGVTVGSWLSERLSRSRHTKNL